MADGKSGRTIAVHNVNDLIRVTFTERNLSTFFVIQCIQFKSGKPTYGTKNQEDIIFWRGQ